MQVRDFLDDLYPKKEIQNFKPGDTVRVLYKIYEGEEIKIHPFEGIVIRSRGSDLNKTFTVRKISFGIGVERTFPLYSPNIEKIEVIKSGKTRRAKLYYIRKLLGKAASTVEELKDTKDTQDIKEIEETKEVKETKLE